MKNVVENIKDFIDKIGKKRLLSLLVTCLLILAFIGGTFALWDWKSTDAQKTEVVFTLNAPFTCSADVGGNINPDEVPLAPTTCTNAKHVIKRELTVYRTVPQGLTIYMDLWLDINSIAPELSASENLRYALTTSDNSCTDNVIVEGTFNGKQAGDKVDLFLKRQYTETVSAQDEIVYYLYIWLDAAETNLNTAGKSFDFSINGECVDDNPENTITFDANGGEISTLYTEPGEHIYTVLESGTYKLEVWGAQGGDGMVNGIVEYDGGYGGYSAGSISLVTGTTLYANVGGKGGDAQDEEAGGVGGYNGGGTGGADTNVYSSGNEPGAGGGGASHIAIASGELKDLSSNISSVIIVAGGGGGGAFDGAGGSGGGIQGMNGTDTTTIGATQTSGYAFGLGSSGLSFNGGSGAGGGGYYGGGAGTVDGASGTGGSGYIGSSLLTSKVMYCYNCTVSDESNTLTNTTTEVSKSPVSNYAKIGDGAIKITKLNGDRIVTNGSTYGTLPTPVRDGYIFSGWNTESDGSGTFITSDLIVNLTDNITLYAIWHEVTIESVSGGVVTLDAPPVAGEGVTFTATPLASTTSTHYAYEGATITYTEDGEAKQMWIPGNIKSFTVPNSDVTITPRFYNPVIKVNTSIQYSLSDDAESWVKVFYCASYDEVSNQTIVVLYKGSDAQRLFHQGSYYSSTGITIEATDSGAIGKSSSYASGINNSGGRIFTSPTPSPSVIYLQHSDGDAPKTITVSARTVYSAGTGSGSESHTMYTPTTGS